MKITNCDIPAQIRAMGRAAYLAGKSTCPFGPKSNAWQYWHEGWREAERWPLILMMEGA